MIKVWRFLTVRSPFSLRGGKMTEERFKEIDSLVSGWMGGNSSGANMNQVEEGIKLSRFMEGNGVEITEFREYTKILRLKK